ncbi:protein of unknown function [Methylocaldum szegediense]|uniref:Uncharacterized protein n=1 Tax=Methylocaldum szegediense TaxID=73780 RepID=A0ABN8WWB1_9GAMM|nr:protein of unknown function [Methylocaldum szegediense]
MDRIESQPERLTKKFASAANVAIGIGADNIANFMRIQIILIWGDTYEEFDRRRAGCLDPAGGIARGSRQRTGRSRKAGGRRCRGVGHRQCLGHGSAGQRHRSRGYTLHLDQRRVREERLGGRWRADRIFAEGLRQRHRGNQP